jgi:hypothetical protein
MLIQEGDIRRLNPRGHHLREQQQEDRRRACQ